VSVSRLTEPEWLAGTHISAMLLHVQVLGDRKLRLFATALCRLRWHLLRDQRSRQGVEAAEAVADGIMTERQRNEAQLDAQDAYENLLTTNEHAAQAVVHALDCHPYLAAEGVSIVFRNAVEEASWRVKETESQDQVAVLRHIFGNPFRPVVLTEPVPTVVRDLAKALYAGQNCHLPLCDALLEAGHADLAEHFRAAEHPKGCWALDAILGKN